MENQIKGSNLVELKKDELSSVEGGGILACIIIGVVIGLFAGFAEKSA